MKKLLLLLLALTATFVLSSCETPTSADGHPAPSELPWTTPAPWEGNGGIGSLMPQSH